MEDKQEQKSKKIIKKSLASQLRSLPEVRPPEALKDKLFAAIPDRRPKPAPAHQPMWYRAWDYGATAAAAVLIVALMFLVNYGLSTNSMTTMIEFDTSLCYAGLDQNNFLYDQNNTSLEKSVPYKLK